MLQTCPAFACNPASFKFVFKKKRDYHNYNNNKLLFCLMLVREYKNSPYEFLKF